MRIQIESTKISYGYQMQDLTSLSFPLVAWDEVCGPKLEGGLGIRKNEGGNKITITKLGWRILTDNNNIQARTMREKYIKNNNFFRIPKKKGDSIVWKEVINHRKYIGAGLKWCIGDGRKVYFWTDYQVYMLPLISFVDENHLHYINWDAKVYDFINQDSKEWNLQSISSILPLNVLSDIKAILIPSCPLCDRIFWGSSQDGKSTLKSATWAMRKPLMTLDPNYYIGFGNYIYAKFKILLMANYSKSLPTCEFVIQKNGNFKHVLSLQSKYGKYGPYL